MDQRDQNIRSGRSASRPPAWEGGSSADSLFTEIPLDAVRRTPNSGRPAEPRPAVPAPDRTRRPARESASPRSAYEQPSRQSAPNRPRQPLFTELSWDDLRSGNFDPAPPVPPEPTSSGDPFEEIPDYRSYTAPPRRTASPRYNNSTRTAPAHRSYVRDTYQRDPNRPGTAVPRSYSSGSVPPRTYGGSTPSGGGNMPPRRPRKRGLHPIFYVIGLILAVLVIVGIHSAVKSIGTRARTPKATPVQYVPGSAVTPAPATPTPDPDAPEEAEATPAPTAAPTPEPTPTPSGPKAKKVGDLIVPADWGPAVPERFHAQYDSYFDKSCMIGNSLVEGFFMWSGLTNIRYVYHTGAVVSNVIGVMDLGPIALNPGYYTDIYLMFGLNEVGSSVNSFTEGYKKLVDFIRGYQPTANIYVISVTPVTEKTDKDPNEVQTMERINNFNAALKQFCADSNCWYLDIYSMLLDEDGYLSADYAFAEDGKHFEKSGYVAWANYMKTHYVDEGLLTE